ncbi:hypothetical protein BGZ57DRAFT_998130 [Hyaloscypha finlandica]|nr:hypothetical protein BGZ57DRAFT_998130 [Hyaloscypha finlandica]
MAGRMERLFFLRTEVKIKNLGALLPYHDTRNRSPEGISPVLGVCCVGNLSIALSEVGSAYAASSNGASTLLTLIPTAGALIGAPARELWVRYKLMPIAGILSMMLSLGGNIVPMDISDYEQVDTFSYAGMIPTADQKTNSFVAKSTGETEAERFAALVHSRARDKLGARRSVAIWFGIILQCFWLTCILIACWFLDSGSIIVWWCTNNGWMFFWFGIVAMSSLMENLAGVPFSRQWTIRVSRAPRIEIDEGAPWAIEPPQENYAPPTVSSPLVGKPLNYSGDEDIGVTTTERITTFATSSRTSSYNIERKPLPSQLSPDYQPVDILEGLEKGYNTVGRIVLDRTKPWSASNDAFYVLLSVKGVSHAHAIFRVFSKFISICVFATGTCLFASSTLVTILASLVTAALILCAGIFGRVTAMWMASEMMKNKPVLHRVVQSRDEAGKYMDAILRQKGIACEVLGHVIVEGRCIKKFGKRLRWSSLLGVLASPYP